MPRTPGVVEDRREQIINAAMRVFAHKGFVRATNRDIAREAGITSGLIYYYFPSKEALLQAVLEERSPWQVVAQIPSEMLEQPPEVFLPVLLKRVLAIIEGEQFVQLIRVILPEIIHNPELAMLVPAFIQRVTAFLQGYIEVQAARGVLRGDLQVDMITQTLVGSLMGMVLRRQIMRDPAVLGYTHEEIVQSLTTILLTGLRAR